MSYPTNNSNGIPTHTIIPGTLFSHMQKLPTPGSRVPEYIPTSFDAGTSALSSPLFASPFVFHAVSPFSFVTFVTRWVTIAVELGAVGSK